MDILEENNVKTLVDVRHNPYSMNKDFIRKFLAEHLQRRGIKYEHLRDWGIPSKVRKEGNAMEWYAHNVRPNISGSSIEVMEHPVCFMCMENDIESCHRRVILETLGEQGLSGRDLAPRLDPKRTSRASGVSDWDEAKFFKTLDESVVRGIITIQGVSAVRSLYDASKALQADGKAAIGSGSGKKGSFVVRFPALTGSRMLFKMDSEGMIQIAVGNLPEEKRKEFLNRLKGIGSLNGCFGKPQGNYYIKMDRFEPAMDAFIESVRAVG